MAEGRLVRRQILFAGRVQGVGFRMTSVDIAASYEVAGTVRNLSDGRVEIIAEGEAGEIDRFAGEIERTFAARISQKSAADLPWTGAEKGFVVRG